LPCCRDPRPRRRSRWTGWFSGGSKKHSFRPAPESTELIILMAHPPEVPATSPGAFKTLVRVVGRGVKSVRRECTVRNLRLLAKWKYEPALLEAAERDRHKMPKRIGRRQYCSNCSDRARAVKYRQKASLDEGRDYAWLYRLKREEPTTRNARLRQKKVQERIREIKSRQKESSRCQGLLQAMNL
jgi:hypothetical protein